MNKKQIIILILFNMLLFVAEYFYFREEQLINDQEDVRVSTIEAPEGPYIEVRATRLK